MIKHCKVCKEEIPTARAEYGFDTCIKHSDEKAKDHQPTVVDSRGLHEKYSPEERNSET